MDGAYELNSYNMHRLILTGIMVAAKFVDDFYFSNNYWSKVGGIPNDELNGLEMELLFLLNFSLHTTRGEYDDYAAELARRQVLRLHASWPMVPPCEERGQLLTRKGGCVCRSGSRTWSCSGRWECSTCRVRARSCLCADGANALNAPSTALSAAVVAVPLSLQRKARSFAAQGTRLAISRTSRRPSSLRRHSLARC